MLRSVGTRLALASVLAFAWACSSDGHTPDCPPLPRYKVGQPLSDEVKTALANAAEKGCVTLPIGGSVDDGGGGAGGSD